MKKIPFLLLAIVALVMSCENSSENEIPQETSIAQIDMSDFYVQTDENESSAKSANGKSCHSMNVLNRQLKENPGLYNKMYDVELHTRQLIAAKKPGGGNGNGNGGGNGGGGGSTPTPYAGTVTIPVYVHVVYANSQQNISNAQVNSQISVLNADFNDSNYNDIPSEFQGVAANTDIHFTLDSGDIARHSNSTSSWGTSSAVKSTYPPVAGYLNIWVCNIGGGILGYAQFPGGNSATDGVVISPQYFGTTGFVSAPFDGGRTATHEVGHWLNLRHIWGDGRCKQDDFVADTPSSDGANYGCPSYPTRNCRTNDMTMNYMDYTDDACMNMFTDGQNDRMRTIFAAGGSRESFVN